MSFQNFSQLDFDRYKQSLRDFLESQEQFRDYNFDGAAISTLLDVLSYNTTMSAFNANMVASERFLPTAQRRGSVVSAANGLGYTPVSATGATARIQLKLTPANNTVSAITIPENTKFTAKSNNVSYSFFTENDVVVQEENGEFKTELDIVEGKLFTHRFSITHSGQALRIPNQNVDTARLTVTVFASQNNTTGDQYSQVEEFVRVDSTSQVYFLEEREDEYYYIIFGDNVVGQGLSPGQVVQVQYFKVAGEEANGIQQFSLASSISQTSGAQITKVIEPATGGAPKETITEVRKRARNYYQRQNRTVTANDYAGLAPTLIPSIKNATAWGGEDNKPPAFGRVFISAVTQEGFALSKRQKDDLRQEIDANYNPTGIEPIIIDPRFKEVNVQSRVDYNSNQQNPGGTALRNQVIDQILQFSSNSLEDFQQSLRFSQLIKAIDDTHPSIAGNTTEYTLTIEPTSIDDFVVSPSISFGQAVEPNSVTTQRFEYLGFSNVVIRDDGDGNLDVRRFIGASDTINVTENVGTIDYDTGELQFTKRDVLRSDALQQSNIRFTATIVDLDIIPERNEIIRINPRTVSVTVTDIITGITTGAF